MKNNDYLKLKQLAHHINTLLSSGKWNLITANRRQALKDALARLAINVSRFIGKRSLIKTLGAAAILISIKGNAQSFTGPVTNPFGLENTDFEYVKHEFVDIDGDGDVDLFFSYADDGLFYYRENSGSPSAPAFEDTLRNPFGLTSLEGDLVPIFGDLDNDGDFDILTSSYGDGVTIFYENTGTETAPAFATGVSAPFGLTTEYLLLTDFVDIDDDGDLDLFGSMYDDESGSGRIHFIENTGTEDAPTFTTPIGDPFGLNVSADDYLTLVDFADIDNDGDMDFMRTNMYGDAIYYHENTGTADTPEFEAGEGVSSPFGITTLPEENFTFAPTLVDIDADGDSDLFVSDVQYGNAFFFENRTYVAGISETEDAPEMMLSLFPNPAIYNIQINTSLTPEQVKFVQISSMDGKVIYQSNTLTTEIQIHHFEKGLYLLEVTDQNGNQKTVQFLKK